MIRSHGDAETRRLVERQASLIADREGQFSIRIHDRDRICFEWRDGDAYHVEIVDYH